MSVRSRSQKQSQTRGARSSSIDGSVVTVSSIPSIPSIQVSPDIESWTETGTGTETGRGRAESIPREVEVGVEDDPKREGEDDQTIPKRVDHERQLLLLYLLAQVCALHDPTPRTFT